MGWIRKLRARSSIRVAAGRGETEPPASPAASRRRKWLPVIDTDSCGGCGRCIEACDAGCLELIWSFATLVRPESCTSAGPCEESCPTGVLRMGWVVGKGDPQVGRWERGACSGREPAAPVAERARSLLIEMLARVRHTQDAPLHFGIDGARIAQAAMSAVDAGLDPVDCLSAHADEVMAALERLAREALGAEAARATPVLAALDPTPLTPRLARWMEAAHARLSRVHPLALDILGRRVEGDAQREVAQQLDLGLRLTTRLCAELRAAW